MGPSNILTVSGSVKRAFSNGDTLQFRRCVKLGNFGHEAARRRALTEADIEKVAIDIKIKNLQLKKKEVDAKYESLRKKTNDDGFD